MPLNTPVHIASHLLEKLDIFVSRLSPRINDVTSRFWFCEPSAAASTASGLTVDVLWRTMVSVTLPERAWSSSSTLHSPAVSARYFLHQRLSTIPPSRQPHPPLSVGQQPSSADMRSVCWGQISGTLSLLCPKTDRLSCHFPTSTQNIFYRCFYSPPFCNAQSICFYPRNAS